MLNSKLDIIKETLKTQSLDKHFYEIVASMSAEEWNYALSNLNEFDGLLPYLIYTYDQEKIDELADKFGQQAIARSLVEAWFMVVHGGVNDPEEQPRIDELAKAPILLHVFNGHLLKMMECANYEQDITDFMLPRFKGLLQDFTTWLVNNNNEAKQALVGCYMSDGAFPCFTDYDDEVISDTIQFVYVLGAIKEATDKLCIGEVPTSRETELIEQGDYSQLIQDSACSETQKRRNTQDLPEIEQYVANNCNAHNHKLGLYMFTRQESLYLHGLMQRGILVFESKTEEPEESDDMNINIDLSDVSLDEADDSDVDDSPTVFDKLKTLLDSRQKEAKTVEIETENGKELVSKATYEDLVMSGKKKKNNLPWFLLAIGALISWGVAYFTNETNNQNSIIEQTDAKKAKESQYKVVKVYE